MKANEVPCGTCNLCCIKGGIKLRPSDYLESGQPRFAVMPNLLGDEHELAHIDGKCVYLTDYGCAIQHNKPEVCAGFDCRKITMTFSKKEIYRLNGEGYHATDYWERGKELILAEAHPDG